MNKLKAQVTQIAGGILTAGYFVLYKTWLTIRIHTLRFYTYLLTFYVLKWNLKMKAVGYWTTYWVFCCVASPNILARFFFFNFASSFGLVEIWHKS